LHIVSWYIVEDVSRRQPLQRAGGCPVFGIGCDFLLFTLDQLLQFWAAGAKAQLPVEPERARFDGFLVFMA